MEVLGLILRNRHYNLLNAVASAVALNLITPYVGIYAVRLGADNLQLGYLSSWPNIASVVAVLATAAAVAHTRNKKRLISAIFLVGRAAALGAAAVPWFPEAARIWALIAFWVLAYFPNSAAITAQQSFLADVFSPEERGRIFATRNAWNTGASMLVVLISGWLLDHLFPYPLGYQLIFAASFAAGLAEIYFFLRMKERPAPAPSVQPAEASRGWQQYRQAFSHQGFRQLLLCSIPFHFTWQMAWPIFTRFQVTDLGMDNTALSIVTVANAIVATISYSFWARLGERYGNAIAMGLAALHLATAPILTSLVPNVLWLVGVNLFTGASVAGVTLLVLNLQLEVSPSETRPVFLAVHTALVSISASIAPMVGAYLMSAMPTRLALGVSTIPRVMTGSLFFFLALRLRRLQAGNHLVPGE